MIWFIIAFPFIPSLVPGTDNQPTFSIVIFILLLFASFSPNKIKINFLNSFGFYLALILIITLGFSIVYNFLDEYKLPFLPRLFGFLQFIIAFIFGTTTFFTLHKRWLQIILWIYAIFTFIYYLTGGLIEEFLIRSRVEGVSEFLADSGRGARTLSPEPSILALHILNIILLNFLIHKKSKLTWELLLLALIPLLGSLSGYGFFIAVTLILIFYPKLFFSISSLFLVILTPIFLYMQDSEIRVLLILRGFKENGIAFFLQDESFFSRFNSFLEYKNSFIHTFPFGDAFTIFGGGGIISLISALGLIGLLFFIVIFIFLLFSNYSMSIKVLFFAWLLVYFISGSFGVPLFGLILGVFITNSFKYEKSIYITSSL